ncbi:right-handed parallel beta-helix repeat-containing protein [Planctomycetota bacterium]
MAMFRLAFGVACLVAAVVHGQGKPVDARSDFVVSPQGNDMDPGTAAKPFATLARARDAVRELRRVRPNRDVVVLLRGGVYRVRETIVYSLEDSAPEGHTTTYAAHPGERPILSAGVPVTDWRKTDREGVWEATLPDGVRTVRTLYDGRGRLPRARGKGFVPPAEHPQGFRPSRHRMHVPKGAVPSGLDLGEAELAVVPNYPWAMNILPIKAFDARKQMLDVGVPATYPLERPRFGHFPGGTAWIENDLSVLDQPGEWCVDAKARKLYLKPRGGEPKGVLAPAVTEVIRVEGKIDYDGPTDTPVRGLVFRGLTFLHGDRWDWEPGKIGWGLQHDWEMFDRPTAMVRLRGAEDCVFDGCRFAHSGGAAIRLDLHCQRNQIRAVAREDVGGCGVLLAGYGPGTKDANRENQVVNNHIHHTGRLLWSCPAVFVWQSGHNRVAHNLIHHCAYTALVVSGRIHWRRDGAGECSKTIRWAEVDKAFPDKPTKLSWHQREPFLHGRGNVVELNEIHHCMEILGDGNCIYISGTGGGNVVRRNYLHDVDSYNMNAAIRCDDDQHGTVIDRNVVWRTCGEGFIIKGNNTVTGNVFADIRSKTSKGVANRHQRGYIVFPYGEPQGSIIQRNVFLSRERGQRVISHGRRGRRPGGFLWECEADRNLYWNTADPHWADAHLKQMRAKGAGKHSIAADPKFVDLGKGDFRLQPDSPARKLGFEEIDVREAGLTDDFPRQEPPQ